MRYNIFLLVHKGLRAMLYDASMSLQRTDLAVKEETEKVLDKVATVIKNFERHAHHEDAHVFPLLQSCAAERLAEMEKEHETDEALGTGIIDHIAAYRSAQDAEARINAGTKVMQTFSEFTGFNLYHMNKEETLVNEILWNNYTDAQLMETNQRLVSGITPEEAEINALWMVRSCNDTELIKWINAIKDKIPGTTFEMIMKAARTELPEERHLKIKLCVSP